MWTSWRRLLLVAEEQEWVCVCVSVCVFTWLPPTHPDTIHTGIPLSIHCLLLAGLFFFLEIRDHVFIFSLSPPALTVKISLLHPPFTSPSPLAACVSFLCIHLPPHASPFLCALTRFSPRHSNGLTSLCSFHCSCNIFIIIDNEIQLWSKCPVSAARCAVFIWRLILDTAGLLEEWSCAITGQLTSILGVDRDQ